MNVCSIGSTCCCNSNKSAVLLQIISANKNVKNRESIMEGVVKKSTQKQLDKKRLLICLIALLTPFLWRD